MTVIYNPLMLEPFHILAKIIRCMVFGHTGEQTVRPISDGYQRTCWGVFSGKSGYLFKFLY